jgi:nucleotide-binding universal stress UspA family protein
MRPTAALPPKVRDTYSTVLVPVDFTSLGWRALPLAERLSSDLGLPLELVHVDTASPWREEEADLTLRATPYRRHVEVRVVADKEVGHGIARAEQKPLVVMSTHAHTGPGELLSGSSVEEILHAVDGAIVTVGPRFERANAELVRLVACIDANEVPENFVDDIASWSRDLSLPVEVLTVSPRSPDERLDDENGPETRIRELAEQLAQMGVQAHSLVLRGSRPGHDIVEYVDQEPGTLVALTTHARSAGPRTLLGSVGLKVVRRAQSPVLLRRRS